MCRVEEPSTASTADSCSAANSTLFDRLGDVIGCLKVVQERPDDDVINNDLILVWGSQRRIITGSDLLGRLLRGIANVEAGNAAQQSRVP
jgi:hypothetical protein